MTPSTVSGISTNSIIPQNEIKSSFGETYDGKTIEATFSTKDESKDAIASAELVDENRKQSLFIPSNKSLDEALKHMMQWRSKDENRLFFHSFGTSGDGFLYVTDGSVLERVKVRGIDKLGEQKSIRRRKSKQRLEKPKVKLKRFARYKMQPPTVLKRLNRWKPTKPW